MSTKVVKRKRLRLKQNVLVALCIVLMVSAGACALLLFSNRSFVSESYAKANPDNKLAQEKIVSDVYKKDDKIYALHYPKFDQDLLNERVLSFVEKAKFQNDEAQMIYIDYESAKVLDQYISVSLMSKTFEQVEDKNPVHEMTNIQEKFVYDIKENKFLVPQDCLRVRGLVPFKNKEGLHVSDMDEQSLSLGYMENEQYKEERLLFQDYPTLWKLDHEKIPSLSHETIVPAKHEVDDRPMIAFTFDDGPNEGTTQRIANAFVKENGRATFFELGSRMEWFPSITQFLVEQGHQVASHSYSHPYFTDLSVQDYMNEVTRTEDIFYQLTGQDITVFRAPGGFTSEEIEMNVGLPFIMWDIDSMDWSSRDTGAIMNEILPYVQDGAIILCHDLYEPTADAIEKILPELSAMGYQFVTIDELMARKGEVR